MWPYANRDLIYSPTRGPPTPLKGTTRIQSRMSALKPSMPKPEPEEEEEDEETEEETEPEPENAKAGIDEHENESTQNVLSDLVRDSKIETRALESCIQHIFYETGHSARERHLRREERWVRQAVIGRGAYGSVYLEKCEAGHKTKLRAVKEIKKHVVLGEELDYLRELEAIAKFSHPKVLHPQNE